MKRLVVVAFLLLLLPSSAAASFLDNPPPLGGWTHPSPLPGGDSPQRHGIALSGGRVVRSSPVIAEIDGNTANGKEAAVGGTDGVLYVYRANGQLLWSVNVMPVSCTPTAPDDDKIGSAPAVGAIYGNGVPYVVVSYGTIQQSDCDGGIAVYHGASGALNWRFSTRAWQASQGYPPEELYGVIATPALADTDGDGVMEIGFGGFDRNAYLLNADGTVRWYYHAADTIWASPAFTDANGDGRLDLIVATPISANPFLIPPTFNGGFVYAFDSAPRTPKRIEFCSGGCAGSAYIWQTFIADQVIVSSPVIGDVLPSNNGLELVVGSGCFFPVSGTPKYGNWIKIMRLSDGAVLQTLNLPAGTPCMQSSVALGDVDDDGKLDVVATLNGAAAYGGDGLGRVAMWQPTVSSNRYWEMVPRNANVGANNPYLGDLASPVIADVDGNGSLEVIVTNMWDVIIINGKTGAQLTCDGSGCGATTSLFAWYTLVNTPAVGDMDGNGTLEIIDGGGHYFDSNPRGYFYAWTGFAGLINSPPGAQPAYSAPWPMFRGNAQRTGAPPPQVAVSPASINMLMPRGQTRSYSVRITRSDGVFTNWSAGESNDPNNIMSLNPSSGSPTSTLTVTLSAPLTVGVYYATAQVQSAGLPTVTLPITLTAPQVVYDVLLPMIRR